MLIVTLETCSVFFNFLKERFSHCNSTVCFCCVCQQRVHCCSLCSWWKCQSALFQGWPKLSCTMLKPVFQLGLKPRGVCCSSKTSLRNRLFWLRQHILTFQARHDTEKYLQQSFAAATDEHQPLSWVLSISLYRIVSDAHIQQLWGPFERMEIKTDDTSQICQTRLLNSSEN